MASRGRRRAVPSGVYKPVPEYGSEIPDFTYDQIMKPESNVIAQSIKYRDRTCALVLPILLVSGIAMIGIVELLAAKFPLGDNQTISRADLKDRNDSAQNANDFVAWAWTNIIAIIVGITSLFVVLIYYMWVKKDYDSSRGCAKNNEMVEAERLAKRVKLVTTIFSVAHALITVFFLIVMTRSFWELGGTSKRDPIHENANFAGVEAYYYLWGFGSLVLALGNLLAAVLFFYNSRYVVQACGGLYGAIKRRMSKSAGSLSNKYYR